VNRDQKINDVKELAPAHTHKSMKQEFQYSIKLRLFDDGIIFN